jgi:hypothetical protein
MSAPADFRTIAHQHRVAASQETLVNRREMYERSAILWDEIAQRSEKHDHLAAEITKARIQREESAPPIGRQGG